MKPGTLVPAYVEREFSFGLDGDRIRGRMDRVDIERLPENAAPEEQRPAMAPIEQHPDFNKTVAAVAEKAGLQQVEVVAVAKERVEPFFETLLASGVKPGP